MSGDVTIVGVVSQVDNEVDIIGLDASFQVDHVVPLRGEGKMVVVMVVMVVVMVMVMEVVVIRASTIME